MNNHVFQSKYKPHDVVALVQPTEVLVVGVHFHADKFGGMSPFYDLLSDGQITNNVPEESIAYKNDMATAKHYEETAGARAQYDAKIAAQANQQRLNGLPKSELATAVNEAIQPVPVDANFDRRAGNSGQYEGVERRCKSAAVEEGAFVGTDQAN